MHVVIVQKLQHHRLALCGGLQRWFDAELINLIQIELPLLSKETTVQGVAVLRPQVGPRSANAGHVDADVATVVPGDFEFRLDRKSVV